MHAAGDQTSIEVTNDYLDAMDARASRDDAKAAVVRATVNPRNKARHGGRELDRQLFARAVPLGLVEGSFGPS